MSHVNWDTDLITGSVKAPKMKSNANTLFTGGTAQGLAMNVPVSATMGLRDLLLARSTAAQSRAAENMAAETTASIAA